MQYTEEQRALIDSVEKMTARVIAPHATAIDEDDEVPRGVIDACGDMGLLQFRVPANYGGPEGSAVDTSIARETIARTSAVCSLFAGQNSIIIQPLLVHGTEEQRQRILPRLAKGRSLAAIAITEPEAGSDPSAMTTRATRTGDRYIVNGHKTMISHGAGADYMLLFAKTGDAKEQGSKSISAFIVEPEKAAGMTIGRREKTMGLRGHPIYELHFDGLEIPEEDRVGAEGDGFRILARTLTVNRPMVGSMAIGLAQGALDLAVEHARNRKQFGKAIIDHQAIQVLLADMTMQIEAARSLVYRCLQQVDSGVFDNFQALSSMAKCFSSDVAMKVTTDAVQILGGYGYIRDYGAERMMRDAKITQIFEGTNQIQRIIIARELKGR